MVQNYLIQSIIMKDINEKQKKMWLKVFDLSSILGSLYIMKLNGFYQTEFLANHLSLRSLNAFTLPTLSRWELELWF